MPFDDVYNPPPVAIPAEQRHDAATCWGEQPVTEAQPTDAGADDLKTLPKPEDWPPHIRPREPKDFGEGWEEVKSNDMLKLGDQMFNKEKSVWQNTFAVGQYHVTADRYRRRVTSDEQPRGACLADENNELQQQVATLTDEVRRLRMRLLSKSLGKCSADRQRALRGCRIDMEKLTTEVERLRTELNCHFKRAAYLYDEVVRLRHILGGGE